ncbi:hypothetical protein L218DRAFT_872707 [Marasmius fiardii PR-910]|nr:hypothetical protein L218DRAFT_872707 [Marasmius fiardii PR-910]
MSTTALPSPSLCPGYRQVQEFGPDHEYEDEEVEYVTLELDSVEPTLISSSENMRLIGLDTTTPFMQLSGTILKGRHDTLIGTELLFTEKKDEQDRSKRHLVYVGSTSQHLSFKEVQLKPKNTSEPPPTAVESDRVDEVTTSKRTRGRPPKATKGKAVDGGSHKERNSKSSRIRKDRSKPSGIQGEVEEDESSNAQKPPKQSERKSGKRKRGDPEESQDGESDREN